MAQNQTVAFSSTMSLDDMLTVSRIKGSDVKFLFEGSPIRGAEVAAMPHLHDFGDPVDSDDVVEKLDRLGLRPATFAELLLFGANTFEEQELPAIAALDHRSVFRFDGIRYVPLLDIRQRRLSAEAWIDVGETHFRFAVCHK